RPSDRRSPRADHPAPRRGPGGRGGGVIALALAPEAVILLTGALIASACALIGTFLVLRQVAMLGDAISHAVLPGIVVAFLLTESRAPVPMLVGAGAVGLLTVFLVDLSARTRRLKEDASIGVVFPALFALGVILITRYAGRVDLDLDCVLYGEIAYAPWDVLVWQGQSIGPKSLWMGGFVLLLNLLAIGLLYKEFKLTTFDPQLAATLGFAPVAMHYLLMGLTSVTVVGAFESVGAILVVAMLIVPPATAYLLTERLSAMLALAVAIGIASSTLGYGVARLFDASIAGAMAAVAGAFFLLAFLVSPRHGLIGRLLRHRHLGGLLDEQLLLLHLQSGPSTPSALRLQNRFAWTAAKMNRVAARLVQRGWAARRDDGRLALTDAGQRALETAGQQGLRHHLPPEMAAPAG
ncbi:MAG: metal ABC transporter permease, partial [Acidobacteriota bacterium]